MIVLAVDTTGQGCSVSVVSKEKVMAEFNINNNLTHSATLMPMIEQSLKIANIDIKDINYFAISTGPGSFTGLRIGASAIKGMAHGLGKKIVEVPTLDALAYNVKDENALIVPIMDARRNQVYTAIYDQSGRITDYLNMDIQSLISYVQQIVIDKNYTKVIFLGDGTDAYKENISEFEIAPKQNILQRASSVGEIAISYLEQDENKNSKHYADIDLFYLRKPQAQREQSSVIISRAEKKHIDAIHAIEMASFSVPWSRNSIETAVLDPDSIYMIAQKDDEIVGYMGMKKIIDEGHIMNIAINKESRGEGIGTKLIQAMEEISGIASMTLEVRVSNLPAIGLYKKMGFTEEGRRKNYYPDTKEDALIMWLNLKNGGGDESKELKL